MSKEMIKKTDEQFEAWAQRTGSKALPPLVVDSTTDVVPKENDFNKEIAAIVHKAGTIKLTEKQKTILYAPVKKEDVEVRPDGLVYLPWMEYETRLREAFGLEYALIPQGLPRLENYLVLWGHWLIIKGCPMGFSIGQQEYFPSNKTMSWGDAIEGAKSNALMRLCKGLGITLELWKPSWIKAWIAKYAEWHWEKDKRSGENKKKWNKIVEIKPLGDVENDLPKTQREANDVVTAEMVEELNNINVGAKDPQIDPESTQKEKTTVTPKKKDKESVPTITDKEQDKVIEFAKEITEEEIPYICAIKDGLTEAQFKKILEINMSHYLTEKEHDVLKNYLLSGKMSKVDGVECIDYLLERLKFYSVFEKKLMDEHIVANRELAQKLILGMTKNITDIVKAKENLPKLIKVVKEKLESKT